MVVQVSLNVSVLQLLDKNATMGLVAKALGNEDVLCMYYDHLPKLRAVFEKYAMADGIVDTMTVRGSRRRYFTPSLMWPRA